MKGVEICIYEYIEIYIHTYVIYMCVYTHMLYVCVCVYALEKHIVSKHSQLWQHDQDIYLEDQNIL